MKVWDVLRSLLGFWTRPGRRRLFVSLTALTLGSGIGVSAAVFALVDGIFLAPPPIRDPGRVVLVRPVRRTAPNDQAAYSIADYRGFQAVTRAFSALAALDLNGAFPTPVGPTDNTQLVNTAWVTSGFLRTLGVVPVVGRPFGTNDREGGPGSSVAISYHYWQRAYNGDRNVVNRPIRLFGVPYAIGAVLPRGFDFPRGTDMWAPEPDTGSEALVDFVGRLAPGVSAAQGRAELDAFLSGPNAPDPGEIRDTEAASEPIETAVTGSARPLLGALGAAVGLLLCMTIVNAAFLVVSRALGRLREVALRSALGAAPMQATTPLIRECLAIAGAGAVVAVIVGIWVLHGLLALAPPELPRIDAVAFSWRLVAGTTAISLAIGAGLGMISSRVATMMRPSRFLVSRTPGEGRSRWMHPLVVTQIAGAVIVLMSAGLALRSLEAIGHIDLGFSAQSLLVGRLMPATERYAGDAAWDRQVSRTFAAIDALPGVTGTAPLIAPPFTGRIGWDIRYIIDGQREDAGKRNPQLALYTATPESFRVLGIRVLAGRPFANSDSGASPPVVIVSAQTASTLWPGRDPIGQRIRLGDGGGPWETVVGVVANTRYRELSADRETVYRPHAQAGIAPFALAVRTRGDPTDMEGTIRRAVNEAGTDVRLSGLVPAETLEAPILARFRFAALLLTAIAVAALVLAIAGLYGAITTMVERRRQEIGIRIALGALPGAIVSLVARQGLLLTVAGIAVGSTAAWVGTRLLSALLYGVRPTDPTTMVAAIGLVVLVAVAACAIPTRRAVRVDPLTAIGKE